MNTQAPELQLEFKIPENLYVPSPPLWIESKTFRGPLDLLLHLIREQNLDILDIPMALIAAQYLEYLKLMQATRFKIAPDYLLMAVRLLQIKSQCLLPRPPQDESVELDPRAELVEQLCAYEKFQAMALFLDACPRWERDVWPIRLPVDTSGLIVTPIEVELTELKQAHQSLKKNQNLKTAHQVEPCLFHLSDKMKEIMDQLTYEEPKHFYQVLNRHSPSLEIIVSFQAVLELAKNQEVCLAQENWHDLLWISRGENLECKV